MIAYLCANCSLLFWINSSVIDFNRNSFTFIKELGGDRLHCPNCTSMIHLMRSTANDIE